MRILVAFAVFMFFFALGCGYTKGDDPVLDQQIEMACANVTDTNWRTSVMAQPSKEVCEDAVYYQGGNGVTVRPCLFGGYPMLCSESDRGIALYKMGMAPASILFIEHADLEKVRPNIVNL
ncbi:MAG: hypothetical protein AAB473_00420 [Patescibacteria group bacterium]